MGIESVIAAIEAGEKGARFKSSGLIKNYVGESVKKKRKRITFTDKKKRKK